MIAAPLQDTECARKQAPLSPDLEKAIAEACSSIAPTWPLDRFIAVNPLWELTGERLTTLAPRLASLSGTRLLMPREWFLAQWTRAAFGPEHLREALVRRGLEPAIDPYVEHMRRPTPPIIRRPRVMDLDLPGTAARGSTKRDLTIQTTSQFCAAFFDEGQSELRVSQGGSLYDSWLRHARTDRSNGLLLSWADYREHVAALPERVDELFAMALQDLGVPAGAVGAYLHGLLLDVLGWASWCAYRAWLAKLRGDSDGTLRELLAVRVAWEWLLWRAGGPALVPVWQGAMASWPHLDQSAAEAQELDWVLQEAIEIAFHERLCRDLLQPAERVGSQRRPSLQAAFCIDVRSEVFRRGLEAQSSSVQTLGFAGFFGLPLEYRAPGDPVATPHLPGLLAPRVTVTDREISDSADERLQERRGNERGWARFKRGAVSSLAHIEALGLFYGAGLLAETFGWGKDGDVAGRLAGAGAAKPRLSHGADGSTLTLAMRIDLAAGMLRAMSLTHGFARLLLLVGHGSSTRNNAHAAGLHCGACCGQTGEINARAAAALLNDRDVRDGLRTRGIVLPANTHVLAALHDTTTDEIVFFDEDEVPATHEADVAQARLLLSRAGSRTRRERAPRLGLSSKSERSLLAAMRARGRDWSQVRPEWGLADNAAFLICPREHCRHVALGGRAFLHDYRAEEDEDGSVLELLLTAPMVVTHWINLQYYASTVDNLRYGSGNKVLHNVVGGHIGVFEGNSGDLRVGLPLQSLHDGTRFRHTPLRLSVVVEAPQPAIDRVLAKHAKVRELVDNEWLYLFQLDAERSTLHARRGGRWVTPMMAPP